MGLFDIKANKENASAVLPQNTSVQWANGAICGQAIMAAIDTVVSLAMLTTDKLSKGTASQKTQFLRPAIGEDLLIYVNILKFGKVIADAEIKVTCASSGKPVAHYTNECMF